jgi:uncharacterized protein YndB with AHSA1/START domain
MNVIGIRFCSVSEDARSLAGFLDQLGLPQRDMGVSDTETFMGAVFPANDSWIEIWQSGEGMPAGIMLQVVVDDADAFADHARSNGLSPEGPMDAHGGADGTGDVITVGTGASTMSDDTEIAEIRTERIVKLSADAVYRAWTERFDDWFAESDTIVMRAEVGVPFFFETDYLERRHPHYGRFLELRPDEYIRMTWVTGDPGTKGAETVVTVNLEPIDDGTRVTLTQAGFNDEESRDGHADAWPMVLEHMEKQLASDG